MSALKKTDQIITKEIIITNIQIETTEMMINTKIMIHHPHHTKLTK